MLLIVLMYSEEMVAGNGCFESCLPNSNACEATEACLLSNCTAAAAGLIRGEQIKQKCSDVSDNMAQLEQCHAECDAEGDMCSITSKCLSKKCSDVASKNILEEQAKMNCTDVSKDPGLVACQEKMPES